MRVQRRRQRVHVHASSRRCIPSRGGHRSRRNRDYGERRHERERRRGRPSPPAWPPRPWKRRCARRHRACGARALAGRPLGRGPPPPGCAPGNGGPLRTIASSARMCTSLPWLDMCAFRYLFVADQSVDRRGMPPSEPAFRGANSLPAEIFPAKEKREAPRRGGTRRRHSVHARRGRGGAWDQHRGRASRLGDRASREKGPRSGAGLEPPAERCAAVAAARAAPPC